MENREREGVGEYQEVVMSELAANDYPGFLVEIKNRKQQAQYQALRAANKELLALYWDIGESIHRKQEGCDSPIFILDFCLR